MIDKKLRERLMVTYGYLLGLGAQQVSGMFGGTEFRRIPSEVTDPLKELLFDEANKGLEKDDGPLVRKDGEPTETSAPSDGKTDDYVPGFRG